MEVASDVSCSELVRKSIINKGVKFCDPGLHRCQDIQLRVDEGIFEAFVESVHFVQHGLVLHRLGT